MLSRIVVKKGYPSSRIACRAVQGRNMVAGVTNRQHRLYSLFDHLPPPTTGSPPPSAEAVKRNEGKSPSLFDVLTSEQRISQDQSHQIRTNDSTIQGQIKAQQQQQTQSSLQAAEMIPEARPSQTVAEFTEASLFEIPHTDDSETMQELQTTTTATAAAAETASTEPSLFDRMHADDRIGPDWDTTSARELSLSRLEQQVQLLHQLTSNLAPITALSLTTTTTTPAETTTIHEDKNQATEREILHTRTDHVLADLERAVQDNIINPSGKHGRSLSAILGNIMGFYSASYYPQQTSTTTDAFADDDTTTSPSVFGDCLYVLSLLDQWNLDRQEPHYQYAILAAVHEQRWQAASDLFQQQIDRDIDGFCPIKLSASPVGLHAIARAAQERNIAAVEPVFEAVTSLSLISPTEQDQHVLAAGTALGLAGDWEGMLSYLDNSINASTFGQSLVAATMHACILCNQNDAALQVFGTLLDGHLTISSEFQWGGGAHQISPLCRDLAMRASADTIEEGYSRLAVDLLNQAVQDELTISPEALEGVLGACEHDQNWRDAVDVLMRCIDSDNKLWIVPGSSLHIPNIGDLAENNQLQVDYSLVDRGKMVSSAMRTCNAARQCGTALLCHILADTAPPGSVLFANKQDHELEGAKEICGPIEQTLLPLLGSVENPGELLSAVTASLCGLSCFEPSRTLLEATRNHIGETADFFDALSTHQYAQKYADSSGKVEEWDSAHRHIHRLCTALHAIHIKGEVLDQYQLQVLSSAYATALRSCTLAKEADAGILLGQRIQSELSRLATSSDDSHSIFGRPTQSFSEYGLILDDNLLATQMKALQKTKQVDVALSLFESAVDVESQAIADWPQTCNPAIRLMMKDEQQNKAELLVQRLIKSTDNIDSFAIAGIFFARAERWSDVADVYHMALAKGCLSRDLGVLAMKAIIELHMPGRLRILRGVIHDCSRSVGQSPVDWLDANYFKLKHPLGFNHARMLMWWNDPNTSHLDELQYALDVFEKRLASGLQAKSITLRIIVTHALYFREGDFPADKKEIVRVPRDRQSWVNLLKRVLQQSDHLKNDVQYLDACAMALRNLGCNAECVKLVKEAMQRGVTVRRSGLNEALLAAEEAGMVDDAGDIKLALSST